MNHWHRTPRCTYTYIKHMLHQMKWHAYNIQVNILRRRQQRPLNVGYLISTILPPTLPRNSKEKLQSHFPFFFAASSCWLIIAASALNWNLCILLTQFCNERDLNDHTHIHIYIDNNNMIEIHIFGKTTTLHFQYDGFECFLILLTHTPTNTYIILKLELSSKIIIII